MNATQIEAMIPTGLPHRQCPAHVEPRSLAHPQEHRITYAV